MAPDRDTDGPRPLLITADPLLLDDLLRLTAAAGAEAEVATDAGAARRSWSTAAIAVVGGDLAAEVAALVEAGGLLRREAVVIAAVDPDDADVWRRAVSLGAEHVVFLPEAEPWLVDRLGGAAEGAGRGGVVLGVLAGRGGGGATVLATGLALAGLRAGLRTMLVDADPLGGGIDLILGAEDGAGLRWPDLASLRGRVSGPTLTAALPSVGELSVLSWDRDQAVTVPPTAMAALLDAACRGSDLVVVDLPRAPDGAGRLALSRASTALLVVPAEVRACAAAARVAATISPDCADLRLVVRGPAPGRLPAAMVAHALALPLAGSMKAEPRLADTLERGEPPGRGPGPLARLCDRLVRELTASAGRRVA